MSLTLEGEVSEAASVEVDATRVVKSIEEVHLLADADTTRVLLTAHVA